MTRYLGAAIIIGALVEIAACLLDYTPLVSFGLVVPIKYVTAAYFVLGGLMVIGMGEKHTDNTRTLVVACGFALAIAYFQAIHALIFDFNTGQMHGGAGMPSHGTFIAFLVCGIAGVSVAFNGRFSSLRIWIGRATVFMASFSMAGYLLHQPWMYWQFATVPNVFMAGLQGMAFPSCLLFLLMGFGIAMAGKE